MGVFDFQEADAPENETRREIASVYENNRSLAMTVPQEVAKAANISKGDRVVVSETENGFKVEVTGL